MLAVILDHYAAGRDKTGFLLRLGVDGGVCWVDSRGGGHDVHLATDIELKLEGGLGEEG
jgi:hypothetical protein